MDLTENIGKLKLVPLFDCTVWYVHPIKIIFHSYISVSFQNKSRPHSRGEYNVYSTFQSHEPEFDYLKSLEIEEKINKIRWLPQQNAAHFLLSTNGKDLYALYFIIVFILYFILCCI